MVQIKFQDPPPPGNQKYAKSTYDEIVSTLAQNPGRWALVLEDANPGIGGYLKNRYGFDITTRRNKASKRGDGVDVYAKFRPPHGEEPPKVENLKITDAGTTVDGEEEFFTIAQLAKFLETTATELHKLNYTGRGPRFYRVKNEIRYRPVDIGEWLSKNAYQAKGCR